MIRDLCLENLAAVTRLEQQAHISPWSENVIKACLTGPHTCRGLFQEGQLCGFTISQQVLDEVELHNICVDPARQRQGCGAVLMAALLAYHNQLSASFVFLEVRCSNQAAIALYEREGFSQVGHRAGYYKAPIEDALLYRKDIVWPDK